MTTNSNQAPFPIDVERTAIAIAYRNPAYIADAVLPRVTVGKKTFTYNVFPVAESFTLPDTRVGRRSRPNVINLSATEASASCEDYGLDDLIPQDDIDNAPQGHKPLDRSTMQLADYVALDREVRAASLVFAAASYATGCKTTLSGTSQFSHADSDPISVILTGLDACLIRPNIGVFGQAVWTKIATHPKIVAAVNRNSGDKGIATREDVAKLFELEEVFVGQSRLNTARKGQTATLSRVWGKHGALLYRDKMADTRGGITFGFTAEYGTRISGGKPDGDIGIRGGIQNRVAESVKELIVASQAGYFIEDAVA
ncbi:MAG: phage capsid protein [Alphaproteobacteria bacterium]|nr:phage capsid protein [Alphaproteobacteria bacterium]